MNSNDTDIPNDPVQPATEAAAAPKRKRAPAKPKVVAEAAPGLVAEVVADLATEVVVKPRAPRKTAAKKAELVAEVVAEAVVDAAPVPAEASPEEAPKKRAPRKKAELAVEPVAEQQPLFSLSAEVPAPVDVETVAVDTVAVAGEGGEGAESAEGSERGGRNRNRRRGRKDRADRVDGAPDDQSQQQQDRPPRPPIAVAAPAPELLAAVGERFADVLAGAFDGVDEPLSDEPQAEVEVDTKRVLAPEPDAPKLQKVLAQAGVGSRRDIEDMIAEGKIEVNGEVAHIGQRISFGDNVRVAGKAIRIRITPPTPRILAYHKPTGEVVTFNDPEGRPTVFRHLPKVYQGKWQSVGRLDLNTEGLLLFTNSGELANQLMHPRFNVEREYAVRVLGTLNPEQKAKLLEGVIVEGQKASFKSIEDGGGEGANHWYRVVITEGRNREVRKLFDTQGLAVSRLIRIRYGTVVLPRGLKRGVWIELGDDDVRVIRRLAGDVREDRPERQDRQDRQDRGQRNDQPRQERGDQQQPQQQQQRPERGADRGRNAAPVNNRRADGRQSGVGPRPSRGQEPRAERPQQNGPDRSIDPGPDRTGDRAYERPNDRNGNVDRGQDRAPDRDNDDFDEVIPHNINPLEQTFDRRFANKGGRGVPAGFGPGGSSQGNLPGQGRGGPRGGGGGKGGGNGPREPDPMQTSVGYIGADAFVRRSGRSGGGGGRGGQGGQGGGGGGGRSGGGYGGRNR